MTHARLRILPSIPILVLGVAVPAVISVVGIVIALFFVRPGDVIVHWSADGTADGWAPAWTVPLGMTFLAVVGTLSFGLFLVSTRREGVSTMHRFLAAIAAWYAGLMTALGLWVLIAQNDAGSRPEVGVGLAIGFGTGIVLGVLAWLFAPSPTAVPPSGRAAPPLELRDGERAVWLGRIHLATPGIVAIVAVVVFSLVATVLAALVTDGSLGMLLLVPVVLLVVLFLTSFWTVRADDDGLTVRSAAVGWPRFHVPPQQIESARTTDVNVIGEFGGWGIRLGRGRRLGVIMRSGEALEVQNRDGGALVVTVDDAAAAASVLSAVAERAAR